MNKQSLNFHLCDAWVYSPLNIQKITAAFLFSFCCLLHMTWSPEAGWYIYTNLHTAGFSIPAYADKHGLQFKHQNSPCYPTDFPWQHKRILHHLFSPTCGINTDNTFNMQIPSQTVTWGNVPILVFKIYLAGWHLLQSTINCGTNIVCVIPISKGFFALKIWMSIMTISCKHFKLSYFINDFKWVYLKCNA